MLAGGNHAFATDRRPCGPGAADDRDLGRRRRHGRELAGLARADRGRRQHRDRPAGGVGHRAEHRVEAPDARLVRIDPHRLGRSHLPERGGRRRRHRAVVPRPGHRRADLAASPERREPPAPQAEHVVAVPGDRRRARLGDDRHGRPQGLRSRRQRAVDARHTRVLRPVRVELGLRLVAAAARRRPLRAGAARDADGRPVLRPAHRCAQRRDGLAGRAADAGRAGVSRFVLDAGAARVRRDDRDSRHGRGCGDRARSGDGAGAVAGRRAEPHAAARLPHRGVAARARRGDLRPRRGSGRCWRCGPAGGATCWTRTSSGRRTTGRTCRRR